MSTGSKDMIINLLDEVQLQKKAYHKKMVSFKKIDDASEAFLIGCEAISVSSLFVTVATINPVSLIIGSVFTSINAVGSTMKRVIDYKAKYESCKTTYNQLGDLDRETRAVLVRNHLEKRDLQNILDDVVHRLSLIEDSSLPITIMEISRTKISDTNV
jgi:hypothetical protein